MLACNTNSNMFNHWLIQPARAANLIWRAKSLGARWPVVRSAHFRFAWASKSYAHFIDFFFFESFDRLASERALVAVVSSLATRAAQFGSLAGWLAVRESVVVVATTKRLSNERMLPNCESQTSVAAGNKLLLPSKVGLD